MPFMLTDINDFAECLEGAVAESGNPRGHLTSAMLVKHFSKLQVWRQTFENVENDGDDEQYDILRIMKHPVYKWPNKAPGADMLSAQTLLCHALLLCQGSYEDKTKHFMEMLMPNKEESISTSNKKLLQAHETMCRLATVSIFELARTFKKDDAAEDCPLTKKQLQVLLSDTIPDCRDEEFFEEVFENSGTISREKFQM